MLPRLITRTRYRWALRSTQPKPLSFFVPLWAGSDAVYFGPVGYGARVLPETMALDYVSKSKTISNQDLIGGLSNISSQVAAYCLEVLRRRGCLPARSEVEYIPALDQKIIVALGCVWTEIKVVDYFYHEPSRLTRR